MHDRNSTAWWRTKVSIAVIGFILIAAFYVLREHYSHVFGLLPYLIILACPLMHLFMHHGHGGHEGQSSLEGQAEGGGGSDQPRRGVS